MRNMLIGFMFVLIIAAVSTLVYGINLDRTGAGDFSTFAPVVTILVMVATVLALLVSRLPKPGAKPKE